MKVFVFAGLEEESTLCRSRSNSPYATSASMLLLHTQVGNSTSLLNSLSFTKRICRCEGVEETGRSSGLCILWLSTLGSYIKIEKIPKNFFALILHML